MVFDMEGIKDLAGQHVGEILDRLGAMVKSRTGGEDDRARSRKMQKIFQVNCTHGGFPRH